MCFAGGGEREEGEMHTCSPTHLPSELKVKTAHMHNFRLAELPARTTICAHFNNSLSSVKFSEHKGEEIKAQRGGPTSSK